MSALTTTPTYITSSEGKILSCSTPPTRHYNFFRNKTRFLRVAFLFSKHPDTERFNFWNITWDSTGLVINFNELLWHCLPLHFHFIWQHFPFWCLTIKRGLAQSSGFAGISGHFVTVVIPSLHLTTPPHNSPLQFSLFRSVRLPYWQWNSVTKKKRKIIHQPMRNLPMILQWTLVCHLRFGNAGFQLLGYLHTLVLYTHTAQDSLLPVISTLNILG